MGGSGKARHVGSDLRQQNFGYSATYSGDADLSAVNAVVSRLDDQARAAVAAGLPQGPFTGVPFALKDLGLECVGSPTTNGSRFFRDNVGRHDSELVARYRRAGLVIVGRTNAPELGLNPSTEPVLHGPTRNPWDPTRIAGGSSGGAAAAVAARLLAIAHASDGGGSIRAPAACCGAVGLKPSRGRVSLAPDEGEGWCGYHTDHAVTRTVRDSAALLDASAGPAGGDPYWAAPPARPFLEEVAVAPGRLRIAITSGAPGGTAVDAECVAAAEDAARQCESLGHHVEVAAPSYEHDALMLASTAIVGSCTAAIVDRRAAELGREPGDDDLEAVTRLLVGRGRDVTGAGLVEAVRTSHRVSRQLRAFFEEHDVLVTPALGQVPPALGVFDADTDDFDAYVAAVIGFTPFTMAWNASGQPAVSLPLGQTPAGLPLGVQLVGRPFEEATLIGLGRAYQTITSWHRERPPMAKEAGRAP